MTGEMNGILDPAMQKMALQSPAGAAFAMRVLGLVLVAVGLYRAGCSPKRAGTASAPAGASVLTVASPTRRQRHAADSPARLPAINHRLHPGRPHLRHSTSPSQQRR